MPPNYGGFGGNCAITVGTILLFPTSGLSAFLIVAGVFGVLSQRTRNKASDAIEAAAANKDVVAVDRAAAVGLLGLLGWLLLAGIVFALMMALIGVNL